MLAALGFPRFDLPVAPGGYVWWYIDALSDDGRHGLALIAFIGSVFSPYYARRRARLAAADPQEHCALNVALYGPKARWAMTERGRRRLQRTSASLRIGPSALYRHDGRLLIDIDEIGAPLPAPVRGRVSLSSGALTERSFALDAKSLHHWWPLAPNARVEVELQRPKLRWSGGAYLDMNAGAEPLEHAFHAWNWSRVRTERDVRILYDVVRRDGSEDALSLSIDAAGRVSGFDAPNHATLPATRWWRIDRRTRLASAQQVQVLRTLEDTPFYARSLLELRHAGASATAVHESLCLQRFRRPWVRLLLPFRMPRTA